MRKNIVAMVLVGGRGSRLEQITRSTAKPAVSFGGKYRLIDFVLSNLSNSGVSTIGLITQYEPYELISYVEHGSTWDLDVNEGGISFLTPYTSMDGDFWQKGTAHAINQHFRFIDLYNPDYVLILSGDHVYKMDYNAMINQHIKSKSDITIAAFQADGNKSRFGILEIADDCKVISFEEKPENAKSDLASMGIYIFNKKTLRELVVENADANIDFGNDIIPLALKKELNICCYKFDGYFRDVGTVASLYAANMDLLDNPHYLKIQDYAEFPIFTKSVNLPPHHIITSTKVSNSMISDGCLIFGEVRHSILSSGVVLGENSVIKDSIIHANTKIGENCHVENAIVVEDSVILANTELIFDEVTVVDNQFLWKLGEDDEK